MRARLLAASAMTMICGSAFAQGQPGWPYGYIPSPAQIGAAFAGKQDYPIQPSELSAPVSAILNGYTFNGNKLNNPVVSGGTFSSPAETSGTYTSPTFASSTGLQPLVFGQPDGSSNFPADGAVLGGPLSIAVPNISGYYSSSVGQSIVFGGSNFCSPNADGSPGNGCSAGGVNGYGNSLAGMLSYGGVDAVGQFIGAGPYQPYTYAGVTLSGSNGTTITLPSGATLPIWMRRIGTWVQLTGLTASSGTGTTTLAGMIASATATTITVAAWGDQGTSAASVNAASYAAPSGVTANVGYVSHLFGQNIVLGSNGGPGPNYLTGAEYDMECNSSAGCPNSGGVTVDSGGSSQIGLGFSVNGTLTGGPNAGTAAFTDGADFKGFSYRGLYLEMNLDGNIVHNATTGLYVDTLGSGAGQFPILVHNPGYSGFNNGNVYTEDAYGNTVQQGLATAGGIQIDGGQISLRNAAGTNQQALIDGPTGNITTNGSVTAGSISTTGSGTAAIGGAITSGSTITAGDNVIIPSSKSVYWSGVGYLYPPSAGGVGGNAGLSWGPGGGTPVITLGNNGTVYGGGGSFSGAVTAGSLSTGASGAATIGGNATVGGTLGVTGLATFGAGATIANGQTITFNNGGSSSPTFGLLSGQASTLYASAALLQAAGSLSVGSNATVAGTLAVTGQASGGMLAVTGNLGGNAPTGANAGFGWNYSNSHAELDTFNEFVGAPILENWYQAVSGGSPVLAMSLTGLGDLSISGPILSMAVTATAPTDGAACTTGQIEISPGKLSVCIASKWQQATLS